VTRAGDTFRLELPDDAWRPAGPAYDRTARLLLTLAVGDRSLRLEAWALLAAEDRDPDDVWLGLDTAGVQELADGGVALDHLANAVGATGPFETHEIGGRGYVLVASPYCT
jgi:hypothetical protein